MDKLLDLLNEREEEEKTSRIKWKIDYNPVGIYGYVGDYGLGFASKMIIISKEYGFIKWLVKKDKIDQTVIDGNFGYFCMEGFDNVDSLLMLLSISDTPINDLISYLK